MKETNFSVRAWMGVSKFDFQTQIHDSIIQNDPYIYLQPRIEAKLEKKREEMKDFRTYPWRKTATVAGGGRNQKFPSRSLLIQA